MILKVDTFIEISKVLDRQVSLVITDPPYDLGQEQKEFLHRHFLRVSRHGVIVFSPPENQWITPADQYGFWVKPISTKNTSRRYSRFVEMLHFYNIGQWNPGRHWSQYTNVFTDLVEGESGHPFEKPWSLIHRLVLNHSNPGDVIFDPFAGSGTVAKVCKATRREYVCWDINAKELV